MTSLKPIGFWSYHRPDGAHSDGRMARLHAITTGEIRGVVGEPVHIFRDLETLRTGDDWKKEIDDALAEASFMIAIVTPGFLRSEWCCYEINQFLKREQQLGGQKLIFPIEYIDIDAYRKARRHQVHDETVLTLLDSRQMLKFADHRLQDPGDLSVLGVLAKLAKDIDVRLNADDDLPVPAPAIAAMPKTAPLVPAISEPEMVWIPPGDFMMGTTDEELDRENLPKEYWADEQPRHRVVFGQGFHIGKYPVTVGEFARFVAETGYAVPAGVYVRTPGKGWKKSNRHDWRDPGFPQDDRHPVTCVNPVDAEKYAQWLSAATGKQYRLPSEAEWEYACRAGTETSNFWGNDRGSARLYANVADESLMRASNEPAGPERYFQFDDGYPYTSPVGTFRPNPHGLYDMLGNVWEYAADDWIDDYKNAPNHGAARTTKGSTRLRVLRGGSWNDDPWIVRSGSRSRNDGRYTDTGFRLARTL